MPDVASRGAAARAAIRATQIFLAIVFISYGLVKVLGGQFFYGDWTIAKKTVGGPFLVWAFFGYSPIYGRFIGFCELVPAIMLLFPRTATVGAAALFAVSLNVTVMDFAFDFPSVKWAALVYTMLLAALLWADRAKLLRLFETEPRPAATALNRRLVIAGRVALGLFLLFVINLLGTAMDRGPQEAAARAIGGNPRLIRSRISGGLGINRMATVDLEVGRATSTDTVHVRARRRTGFSPWVVIAVDSGPPGAGR
jgi:hypothetical protein